MTISNIGQPLDQLWQAAQNAATPPTTAASEPTAPSGSQTSPAIVVDISGNTSSGSTATVTMTKAEQEAAKKALEAQEKAAKEAAEAQAKADKEALEAAEKAAKQAAEEAEDRAKAEAKAEKEAIEAAKKAAEAAEKAAKQAAEEAEDIAKAQAKADKEALEAAEKAAGDSPDGQSGVVAGPAGAAAAGKDNGNAVGSDEKAAVASKASENSRASERAGPKEKGWDKLEAEVTVAVRPDVAPEAEEEVEIAVSKAAAERVQAKMMQESLISLIGSADKVGITLKPIENASTERASNSYAAATPKPDAAETKQRISVAA